VIALARPPWGIGVKRINGGMKRQFVIRGHKRSMGHPSPFRERDLGTSCEPDAEVTKLL